MAYRKASFIFGLIDFSVSQFSDEPARLYCMHGSFAIHEYPNQKVQNIARFVIGNALFKTLVEHPDGSYTMEIA